MEDSSGRVLWKNSSGRVLFKNSHVVQLTTRQVAVKGLLRWASWWGGRQSGSMHAGGMRQRAHILSPLKQGTKNGTDIIPSCKLCLGHGRGTSTRLNWHCRPGKQKSDIHCTLLFTLLGSPDQCFKTLEPQRTEFAEAIHFKPYPLLLTCENLSPGSYHWRTRNYSLFPIIRIQVK